MKRITLAIAALIASVGSAGCGEPAQAAPAPRKKSAEPAFAKTTDRPARYAALRPWLTRHDELPRHASEKRCSDEVIRGATSSDAERTLLLRVEDARLEKKSVLPLRVTRALSSVDFADLEAQVTREVAGNVQADAAKRIDWLASRRYVGVFHVIDYAPPHWIHRVDRVKSEWVAGWLNTWLVVHDSKSGEALCSTHLTVKNETKDEPLQKRLRSETAERLTSELGTELRSRTRAALGKISSALVIDDPPPQS